jgi:hypothetical protein
VELPEKQMPNNLWGIPTPTSLAPLAQVKAKSLDPDTYARNVMLC